jgi:hypothetical protein
VRSNDTYRDITPTTTITTTRRSFTVSIEALVSPFIEDEFEVELAGGVNSIN